MQNKAGIFDTGLEAIKVLLKPQNPKVGPPLPESMRIGWPGKPKFKFGSKEHLKATGELMKNTYLKDLQIKAKIAKFLL